MCKALITPWSFILSNIGLWTTNMRFTFRLNQNTFCELYQFCKVCEITKKKEKKVMKNFYLRYIRLNGIWIVAFPATSNVNFVPSLSYICVKIMLVLPVNIYILFCTCPISWAAQHITVCFDLVAAQPLPAKRHYYNNQPIST